MSAAVLISSDVATPGTSTAGPSMTTIPQARQSRMTCQHCGDPCERRSNSQKHCSVCREEKGAVSHRRAGLKHYWANHERVLARQRERRRANRGKRREAARRWYAANRERAREYAREWCAANRGKEHTRGLVYRRANREKIREGERARREKQRVSMEVGRQLIAEVGQRAAVRKPPTEAGHKYWQGNCDWLRAKNRSYYWAHRERFLEHCRRYYARKRALIEIGKRVLSETGTQP